MHETRRVCAPLSLSRRMIPACTRVYDESGEIRAARTVLSISYGRVLSITIPRVTVEFLRTPSTVRANSYAHASIIRLVGVRSS